MNRKTFALAAAAALLSGQAFATEVANWSPDARAADAYPALVQAQAAGKTRAEVRAQLQDIRSTQVPGIQWTPDASVSEAFPALSRPVATVARSRDEVRTEAAQPIFARNLLDSREGA